MKPELYAKAISKTLGVHHALRIATRCMKETESGNYNNVPKGSVFYSKNKHGEASLDNKYFQRLHNYWKHVYNILRKQANG